MRTFALFGVIAIVSVVAEASATYSLFKDHYEFHDSLADSIWGGIATFLFSLPFGLYALPSAIFHFPAWPNLTGPHPSLLVFIAFYWAVLIFIIRKAKRSANPRPLLFGLFAILALSAPCWFFCVSEIAHS